MSHYLLEHCPPFISIQKPSLYPYPTPIPSAEDTPRSEALPLPFVSSVLIRIYRLISSYLKIQPLRPIIPQWPAGLAMGKWVSSGVEGCGWNRRFVDPRRRAKRGGGLGGKGRIVETRMESRCRPMFREENEVADGEER